MIITFVMDQYGMIANGTTATAHHFAEKMRERGHTVRIVTCIPDAAKEDTEDTYLVKERTFFFFKKLINSHGMAIAKPNKKVLEKAFRGADVVHFFLPFGLTKKGKKVADRLGVASTAAFHLQPENITYNLGIQNMTFVHKMLYKNWRKVLNRFTHLHVPSEMIREILGSYGYTPEFHVISNGVNDAFRPRPSSRPKELEGKYIILMSGRLGHEKRQDLLIRAVGQSEYKDRIQVILCGQGPCRKKLEKLGAKVLKNPPIIKFCDKETLIDTINYCDLYVHTSEVELESIACMEAFVCGKVPVISNAPASATKQFALFEQNIFKHGDVDDLARRIDWFIEHPEEKAKMEQAYLEFAERYRLDACVSELEHVFEHAIAENAERIGGGNSGGGGKSAVS